jgi:hypothetical protein
LVDESRIARHNVVGTKPPTFQCGTAQVRDEDIGVIEELERKRLAFGRS